MSIFYFSCIALNDLIRSANAEDIIDLLQDIWETNFKVLDDIKVGVFILILYQQNPAQHGSLILG